MFDNGFTKSYRGKWEHPAFRNYAEAAVWAWMCDCAAWRRRTFSTKFGPVTLERGQLLFAQNVVAKRFNMGRTVIRRILKTLSDLTMIRTQTDHPAANAGTIITIVNYDKYQRVAEKEEEDQPTSDQPLTNLQPTSDQQEKEKKESKENNEGRIAPDGAIAGSKYAFEGEVIKLVARDYGKWEDKYPNLVKLDLFRSTLDHYDGYLKREGVTEWWHRTQNYLHGEDRKAAGVLHAGQTNKASRSWLEDPDYTHPDELDEIYPNRNPDFISESELEMIRRADSVE